MRKQPVEADNTTTMQTFQHDNAKRKGRLPNGYCLEVIAEAALCCNGIYCFWGMPWGFAHGCSQVGWKGGFRACVADEDPQMGKLYSKSVETPVACVTEIQVTCSETCLGEDAEYDPDLKERIKKIAQCFVYPSDLVGATVGLPFGVACGGATKMAKMALGHHQKMTNHQADQLLDSMIRRATFGKEMTREEKIILERLKMREKKML